MAQILKGAPVAAALTEAVKARAEALKANGVEPCLALLRVGERKDDVAYEHAAIRRCEAVGIRTVSTVLPADCTQEAVVAELKKINADASVHGCLMFRPLPKHLDEKTVCETLQPEKDVDGMTLTSLTTVFTRHGRGFAPCTAQSVIELLDHYGVQIEGTRTAVIGRSLVIGRPVAMMLLARNAALTMCHTKTPDLAGTCRAAELLVVASGHAGAVGPAFTNPGQTVVDIGINAAPDGGICGDVQFEAVEPVVKAITPVPAGVGSVTTAVLCKHVVEAAERSVQEARDAQNRLPDLSCAAFTEQLASRAPVPGGGGAAALIGSLAAALGAMATRLTAGKKKYLSFAADHERIVSECDRLREQFLKLIEADAAAFEPLSRAYSMDKSSPDYAGTMRAATLAAASAPVRMMECCSELIALLEELPGKCSSLLLSDVGCAAAAANAALECAAMNVFVNTRLLPQDGEALELAGRAETLLSDGQRRAQAVSATVMEYLRRSV